MKDGKLDEGEEEQNSSLFAFSQVPSLLLVVNVSREGLAPIVKAYSRLIPVDGLVL